jgi:hypothetical protein
VNTGTREVWERYERDASLFTSGIENAFEALDSAAAGESRTGSASSAPRQTCAVRIGPYRSICG